MNVSNVQSSQVLSIEVRERFNQDVQTWIDGAQQDQAPGCFLNPKTSIMVNYISWINPVEIESNIRSLDGRQIQNLTEEGTVCLRGEVYIEGSSVDMKRSDFELAAQEIATFVLNAGQSPFALRYKIVGHSVGGRELDPVSQIIRHRVDKTSEEIDLIFNEPRGCENLKTEKHPSFSHNKRRRL